MGKYLSIYLKFGEGIDINSSLSHLFTVAFKDFFKPVSVKYWVKYASSVSEELSGAFGIDNSLREYSNELLPDEELIKNIALTKYNGKICLDELTDLWIQKIFKFRFDVIGITNIVYEEDSKLKEGWFLREYAEYNENNIIKGYLTPLFEVSIYSVGMNIYSYSYIFLNKTANIRSNIKTADQNLQRLCERLASFANKFPQINETDLSLKGVEFWNEFDRLRENIGLLPKFADSEYKFIQSKKG